ncbi:hypothetical protein QYE76_054108 [Lolium multiflorum]|uniref:Reverse transcriptase n=1 Tax=Lolium multiflorum TaxID=4521 RepID=A0AAD8WKP6_LOLMU|nr:hypothetical protein QYE76_054108 [Lolium multiflorum]
MVRNNMTLIRCPCRKCGLRQWIDPDSGQLEEHLLRRGFMLGFNEEPAANVGHEEEADIGREDEESPEHGVHHEEGEADEGDDDAGGDGGGDAESKQTPLTSALRDPHVQELLLKDTGNAKLAKLAQMEVDGMTPLYPGCRPEDTRLSVTLECLEMKAEHKWTDSSFSDNMKSWHARLPKDNTLPTSIDEAKKVVCPLDLPHVKSGDETRDGEVLRNTERLATQHNLWIQRQEFKEQLSLFETRIDEQYEEVAHNFSTVNQDLALLREATDNLNGQMAANDANMERRMDNLERAITNLGPPPQGMKTILVLIDHMLAKKTLALTQGEVNSIAMLVLMNDLHKNKLLTKIVITRLAMPTMGMTTIPKTTATTTWRLMVMLPPKVVKSNQGVISGIILAMTKGAEDNLNMIKMREPTLDNVNNLDKIRNNILNMSQVKLVFTSNANPMLWLVVEDLLHHLKSQEMKASGEDDAEAYLSWALKVDKIFRIHNYSGAKKVAMASLEFEDYANTWWEQVVTLREEKGDPPIDTWEDMKEEMQARFVPTHYKTDLFNKLQKLKQGTKTVEEFFKEMELTMMRANIQESENQTIARFFNGLNYPVKKIVEFQQYSNMVELVHQASKAERQVNEDIKYSKSKQYFASKLATSTPTTSVKPSASSTPSKQPSIQSRMKQTVSSTASSKASTGPSNVTCFKCGTQGHKSFECKNTKVMITMENGDIETLSEGEYEALVQAAVANEEDYDEESGEDPLLCTHDPSPSLVVTRVLTTQPQAMEDQRCNIFQTRAGIGGKSIKVIIDGGSCHNLASTKLCEKLNLTLRKHPHPYHVQWLSDKGNVKIQHTVTVNFKIGPYEDTVECDVVPMTVCHMLLGRPWQFDKKAIHDGFSNAYTFKEFQDVFPDELPHGLPPLRGIEHRIDLIPGAPLPNRAAYRTNPEDTKEIQRQIQDLLAKGEVVRLHGIPASIVSDRDVKFMSYLWKSLMAKFGVKLLFSSSSHPQTDGQTEVVNRSLSTLLRTLVKTNLKSWEDCLPHAEFAYNRAKHSTTARSPFMVVYGFEPPTALDILPLPLHERTNMDFDERTTAIKKLHEETRATIQEHVLRQANRLNAKKKERVFEEGDLVWIHLRKERFPQERNSKLKPRGDGPFKVLKRINNNAYVIDIPTSKYLRYFVDPKESKLMQWHAEREKPADDPEKGKILTHPADASQWNALDIEFADEFGSEPRNIRLGMSTDGLNPFGNQSSTHSTWPVFVWPYNLPPGCAQSSVQDYPGYAYVSCQVNHGFKACVKCMDKTPHLQLPKPPGSCKTVFQGTRMWLRFDHPWRKRKDLFNGEEELGRAPRPRSGEEISELLENWEECPAPGKKRPRESPLLGVWKARSVFWDLPYWKVLHTPHSLDVMHIMKNVTESLLGTLMNMPERTKDGPKARTDLKLLGLKKELQYPTDSDDDDDDETETTQGHHKRAKKNEVVVLKPACFTLSEEELERFFECLLGVKVPHGYSGKISRYLDVAKKRFSGMKSHDCHVLMTQILPVAMRGIMDDHVRETLFGLCNFFDVISRKSIGVKQLNRLQEEIVEILCELEIYFPPAFFDIMVHLLVHVVDDIIHLGPTFLHNMMPFERLNGVIKGFVRNRARPDGSIAKGFLTYECISFCQNYLSTENEDVGLPTRKHVGRLAGFGHREGYRAMHVGIAGRHADFDRAHRVALQHIELVSPWVDKHKSLIEQKFIDLGRPRKTGDVTKEHNSTFTGWFKKRLLESPAPMPSTEEQKLIFSLSQGPGHNVRTYQSYDINGYRFYTEEKDKNSEYQNSGVTMLSYTDDKTDVKERFYGRIEEIWELDYVGVTMPMFRVRWAKSVEKDGLYFTTMVIPDAKSKTPSAKNEPWVLASQVDQCFFITDPSKPSRVVVRRGKRSIIGMEGEADKQDIDKNGDPKIEEEFDKYFDKPTTYSKVRRKTTLPAKGCPYTRRNLKVAGLKYSTTAMKKGKNIVKKR